MATKIPKSTRKSSRTHTLVFSLVTLAIFVVFVMNSVGGARQGATPAREDAYRANNVGVARLEQFDYPAAAQAFRRAIQLAPDLTVARVNLAIALFYAGELAPARVEAEAARTKDAAPLQADYVLGLVARAENRNPDAIASFTRVQRADPDDVGSAINLGQLYLQEQKFSDAVETFRRATQLEPYQSTAAYGLATALLRSGAREEGAAAMSRFQQLRDSGYATTFSQNYLDQGRYAAAIASTGAEPDLVDARVPEVRFTEVTQEAIPQPGRNASAPALFDADADGDLDLAVTTRDGGVRLLRNERGRFTNVTDGPGLAGTGASLAVVAGDYDNDERPDLLVLSSSRTRLLHQEAGGSFTDVTAASGLPSFHARTAAWADADHDGDLDIVSPPYLLRNNGNGTFTDVSAAAGIAPVTNAVAVAPGDFDNRRDIDFLVLRGSGMPALLQNVRDGSFRDASEAAGLTRAADWTSVASGDVNKDGFVDFFLGRSHAAGMWAMSDGRGKFALSDAPGGTSHALASQFLDYDNDGLLDLFVVTGAMRPTLLRNIGAGWADATPSAFTPPPAPGTIANASGEIAAGDLDGDGDTDVVTSLAGNLRVWRNDGGNRHPSVTVRLSARISNRSAVGAKVEMRAGSLGQQIETVSASPSPAPADVVFGLGNRTGADVVRVLWPAGILQAEVAPDGKQLSGSTPVRELDRKPSSCPYLYTWNGSRFEFVTDFLGGGEMGYWLAPGLRNTPDPDEYVRIESSQLQPRNGRYELRITNELEEALFLDRAQLIAVAHPVGTEVYPNEGMGRSPGPFALFLTRDPKPPLAATDEHGHDVLDRVKAIDRRYPDDFALERVRGYAKPHALTVTIPPHRPGDRVLLLLTGWTDYAFSRDNVAASQQGLTLRPPSLQVRTPVGRWETAIEDIGVPVGRPQTVPVDLTSVLPANATEVRMVTTMRIYWDRILVDIEDGFKSSLGGSWRRSTGSRRPEHVEGRRTAPAVLGATSTLTGDAPPGGRGAPSGASRRLSHETGASPYRLANLEPLAATLRWRGFSAEASPDGREPFGYDYSRVSEESPWKLMPGRYTREGDVRELLTGVDDMFVVSRPGDEIALSFDAAAVPPLAPGWTRTFLLYADGFSKEMDHHSSSPDQLAPLPFHRMTQYPYSHPERYPDDEAHRKYVARYNTRIVPRAVPPIELASPSFERLNHEDH